jgi:hypothetical protein
MLGMTAWYLRVMGWVLILELISILLTRAFHMPTTSEYEFTPDGLQVLFQRTVQMFLQNRAWRS